MRTQPNTRRAPFVLAGLALALIVGVLLSNFASGAPDGLESAVLKTHCAEVAAAEREACLEQAAGEPVFTAAPLPDYIVTPLSGLLGVLACFALAVGVLRLSRRSRT